MAPPENTMAPPRLQQVQDDNPPNGGAPHGICTWHTAEIRELQQRADQQDSINGQILGEAISAHAAAKDARDGVQALAVGMNHMERRLSEQIQSQATTWQRTCDFRHAATDRQMDSLVDLVDDDKPSEPPKVKLARIQLKRWELIAGVITTLVTSSIATGIVTYFLSR